MYWSVSPLCTSGGETLVLTNNPSNGSITVQTLGSSGIAKNQLWIPLYNVNAGALLLKSAENGALLMYDGNHNSYAQAIVDYGAYETGSSGTNCFLSPSGNGNVFAIRALSDTTQNLNVSGQPNYASVTPVLFYDWGGGQDNELWTLSFSS